jgi:kumamolisin
MKTILILLVSAAVLPELLSVSLAQSPAGSTPPAGRTADANDKLSKVGGEVVNDRRVFAKSVVPLPPQKGFRVNALKPADKAHVLDLQFALETRNSAELDKRVAAGEIISAEEMKAKYSADEAEYNKLLTWLKENGFEVVRSSSDHTSIYAKATVEQIEAKLNVKMARVTVGGVTYDAASSPPSLPANISARVLGINGLQPFVRAHKNFIKAPLRTLLKSGNFSNFGETVATSPAMSPAQSPFASASPAESAAEESPSESPSPALVPAISNRPPYLVGEILNAYNGSALGVTGKGETIAILIDTAPEMADLQLFWQRNKLPVSPSQIEIVNVNQVNPLPSTEGEETLDVEWTSGIAPSANIRVYAAGSLEFGELDNALDQIIADLSSHPGIHQLSISLGLGETYVPAAEIATERQKFRTLAARGVNVFVSSGDAGSNPDDSGHNRVPGPKQVEYESSDPSTIGVGGTTIDLDHSTGTVKAEEGWSGSGGGESTLFDRPEWQKAPNIATGTKRLVPDVSLAADPNTGALFVYQKRIDGIGGTSWSAPVWAGICALLNESRANAGKKPLGFLPPFIYPLAGTTAFRDIKIGTNGAYNATAGYDMVTGIGVPNVKELMVALLK